MDRLNDCTSCPVKAWFLATRPKTLSAAVVPFLVGTQLAASQGAVINWTLLIFALASAFCIQIGTNLINDSFDSVRGEDAKTRLGPCRAIHSGAVTAGQMYYSGMAAFALAFLFAIPLILHGGIAIFSVIFLSILVGYFYTAGPFPLAYLGISDFFVVIFFGLVSVGAAYWLQIGKIDSLCLLLGLQVGLLCTLMLAIDNLRDVNEDAKVGKKTLPVRFGQTFGRIEVSFLAIAPFLLSFFWIANGYFYATLLSWLIFPLAILLVMKIWKTPPSKAYNGFLALASLLHLSFGLLLGFGFLIK